MADPKRSAALALVRGDEVLIAHPGGPYWANKDEGAWTLPKGLIEPGEDALAAARREFGEETGAQGWQRLVAGTVEPGDEPLAGGGADAIEVQAG